MDAVNAGATLSTLYTIYVGTDKAKQPTPGVTICKRVSLLFFSGTQPLHLPLPIDPPLTISSPMRFPLPPLSPYAPSFP